MKSYYLPREYKGEGRILLIFSVKSLIFTVVGALIGIIINFFLKMFGITMAFIPLLLIFGGLGYVIGALKIPENGRLEIFKKVGGEKIDDVIKRWFKFKMKHGKIYIYKDNVYEKTIEGGKKDGQ